MWDSAYLTLIGRVLLGLIFLVSAPSTSLPTLAS
jgi:hypothetical protein